MSDVVVVRQPVTNVDVVESDLTQAIGDARYAALAHHTRHEAGGADGMAIDAAAATGSLRTLGTGAAQAAAGTHAHSGTYALITEPISVAETAARVAADAALAVTIAAIPDPVAMALVFGGGF